MATSPSAVGAESAVGVSRDRMQHESLPRPVTTAPAAIKPVYWRGRRGSSRPRLVSVLVSFTPVRHRSPVVALIVFAQARTLADGGAQYSKACEGASLPWVHQIPPPPP